MNKIPTHWSQLAHAPAVGTLLCRFDDLTDGGVQMFELGGPAQPFRLLLLRSGATALAYVNRCAHFGVPLAAKISLLKFVPHQSLSCNVHYARYRWSDGVCDQGECVGESLLAVPLRLVGGNVLIA